MIRKNFEVEEFRFLQPSDASNYRWGEWSRIYEYEVVLNAIRSRAPSEHVDVHNTCWGFHGCHVLFKEELTRQYPRTLHSDIQPSIDEFTATYDVTKRPWVQWREGFDFVLNISTLEELGGRQERAFNNLLAMVRPGGFLIATFDYPGLKLEQFEKILGVRIERPSERLDGRNSRLPNPEWSGLNVGFLVIKKC